MNSIQQRQPKLSLFGWCLLLCTFLLIIFSTFIYRFVSTNIPTDPVSYLQQWGSQSYNDWGQKGLEETVRQVTSEGISRVTLIQMPNTNGHVSKLIVDVSLKQEFSKALLPHIYSSLDALKDYAKYVVDIGAYDGVLASNSYNLIQLGWDALLVEAVPAIIGIAKQHVNGAATMPGQKVKYDQVAVGKEAGTMMLSLPKSTGHLAQYELTDTKDEGSLRGGSKERWGHVEVDRITVETLLKRNSVPKKFGVLSHDVLEFNNYVVRTVLNLGYGFGI